MAERAGAHIVEARGSHVIMVSQPQAVVDLIEEALKTLATSGGPSGSPSS
jgi:hypothetical protein